MLDINGIRQANLQALTDQIRRGRPDLREMDVALALDLSPSFFSQLKGGKVIGDDVARKIEIARSLPFGWMDNIHPETTQRIGEDPGSYQSHTLRIDPETIAAALKLVRLAFLQREQEIDQEVNGEPLAHAYEFLITRKENTVTPENVVAFSLALRRRHQGASDEAQAGNNRSIGGSDRQHHQRRQAS